MIGQIKFAMQYMLGRDIAGRRMFVYPDDTFIVSYPRSGNTWTRFLIANLVHPNDAATFANIEVKVPDITAHSRGYLRNSPRPRVLKSHEYFDPRYKKVIYIVRDPRDVALSCYHFHLKQRQIEDGLPLDRYIRSFIAGEVFVEYASWGENVASWLATRQSSPGFLVLRYEDMLADPERELAKVAALMGIEPDSKRLAVAVERSSADQMRKLEKAQSNEWVLTRETRKDIPFVRKAAAGGWAEKLPQSSVEEIESAWGHLMSRLGYSLAGRASTALPSPLVYSLQSDQAR